SQAYLWASGRLAAREPLASLVPVIGPVVAPLGYHLGSRPGELVPTYPAGLPLMMALAMKLAGPSGAYLVVPLLSGLSVWLTYVLGGRVADPRSGLIAAILVAFNPIFLFQSLLPMSDVPVTACWLAAWVLATFQGPWWSAGAGLAASMAILTRPN